MVEMKVSSAARAGSHPVSPKVGARRDLCLPNLFNLEEVTPPYHGSSRVPSAGTSVLLGDAFPMAAPYGGTDTPGIERRFQPGIPDPVTGVTFALSICHPNAVCQGWVTAREPGDTAAGWAEQGLRLLQRSRASIPRERGAAHPPAKPPRPRRTKASGSDSLKPNLHSISRLEQGRGGRGAGRAESRSSPRSVGRLRAAGPASATGTAGRRTPVISDESAKPENSPLGDARP